MELLDLPPEIFQRIVHSLVSEARVCKAWKYRQVCRIFASEIYHDVFTNQPLKAFETRGEVSLLRRDLGLYLSNRTKNLLDAYPFVPMKILEMRDYLIDNDESLADFNREEITKKLCNLVIMGPSMKYNSLIYILTRGPRTHHWREIVRQNTCLSLVDKLAIAATAGGTMLIQSLIAQSNDELWQSSIFYGIPLVCIVRYQSHDILAIALTKLEHLDAQTRRLQSQEMNSALNSAIETMITNQSLESAAYLLKWCKKHSFLNSTMFDKCLRMCVRSNDLVTTKAILDIWTPLRSTTLSTFYIACYCNSGDAVKELLNTGHINLQRREIHYSGLRYCRPLEYAVMKGGPEVVRSVLEAGIHTKEALLACVPRARKRKNKEMHDLVAKVLKEQEGIDVKPYNPRKPQ